MITRQILRVLVWLFAGCGALLNAQPAARGAESPSNAANSEPVVLSPIRVSADALLSFGFSVVIVKDGRTQKVLEMTVDGVAPDSEAEQKGLGPLTEISSIDGKDVHEFLASFAKGSELNEKLMNRKMGDQLKLKILVLGARSPKIVTLTKGAHWRQMNR